MSPSLHSDQPIRSLDEDKLEIGDFIARLTRPLLDWSPQESLVVGLYAPWGTGKTSVLNLVQAKLTEPGMASRAVIARFNPWLYQDTETLLHAFFATLQQVTRTTPLLTPKRKQSLSTALRSISAFATPVLATLARPMTGGVDLVKPASEAVLRAVVAALKEGEAGLQAQKKKAAAALNKLGTPDAPARLVVLIDDLDRAEAREVRAMLKLVRLIADLPNVTYVLAMDHARVTRLLSTSDEEGATSYLEKIIQIPLQLPPISHARVTRLMLEGAEAILAEVEGAKGARLSLSERLDQRGVDLAEMSFWRLRTMRDRARLLNSLRFLLLSGATALDVDPVDALLIAYLQAFYPQLVERVRRNKEFLTCFEGTRRLFRRIARNEDTRKRARSAAFSIIIDGEERTHLSSSGTSNPDGSHEDVVDAIEFEPGHGGEVAALQESSRLRATLVALFPCAETGAEPSAEETVRWRRANRIAAPERFDRYFAYTSPEGSATDAEVDIWLRSTLARLSNAPPETAREAWIPFAAEVFLPLQAYSPLKRSDLVAKVLDRIHEIDVSMTARLGYALAYSVGSGALSDGDAANAIRTILSAVRSRRQRLTFESDEGLLNADAPAMFAVLQTELHGAFAVLIDLAPDPFDAMTAASVHVDSWVREERNDRASQTNVPVVLPLALRPVLDAGLARAAAAVADGRDIFLEYAGNPGAPVWRWRDLLRHAGLNFTPLRSYLRGIVREKPERAPDILGLFASWSGPNPSFARRGLPEIRGAAEGVFGWVPLLRAVVQYRQSLAEPQFSHHLIKEFVRMIAQESSLRRQKTTTLVDSATENITDEEARED